MQIEDVARVGLAAGRAAQQQRDFTIRLGVLRQVVVDAQRVAAAVAEVLAHRAGRVRADEEQRRRVRGGGGDHDGVLHRAGLFERPHHLGDRRLLLSDRVVDADDVLAALVDDRVGRDRGLAGLAVADDQLALAAADRHHRVDRLEAGLHRFLDRAAIDDAGRGAFDFARFLGDDRPLAVDRLAERVDHPADQLLTDRHRDDPAGALDRVAFFQLGVLAEQHRADALLFEVQRDPEHPVRKLEHLAGHRVLDAVDAGDAVADRDDRPDLGDVHVDREAANLVADDLGNLFGSYVHDVLAVLLGRLDQRPLQLLQLRW